MTVAIEAEKAVLGSILLNNEAFYEAASVIRADDFSLDSNRRLFARMADVSEAGKPIEFLSIANGWKDLEAIGGALYVASLTDGLPKAIHVRNYCEIVKEKARLRQVMRECEATLARAQEHDATSRECIGDMESAMLRLRAEDSAGTVQHVSEFNKETFANLKQTASRDGSLVGFSTGIDTLDTLTSGIREHRLWLLGGRTGEGKSCLATQIIVANASREVPVLLFTPEMSREQVLERIAIQISGVPAWKFSKPQRMSQGDLETIATTMHDIGGWPLYVDESSSISAQEIAARARLAIKRHKVKLVVVDYVQLIEAKGRDERERVSTVSRYLRGLAKDHAPVVALSQMPRPKDDLNRWPTKYDLKESGSLENDANTIVMIFRKVDKQTNLPSGEDFLVLPKQRDGPVGFECVTFDEDRLLYRPRAKEGEYGQ